MGGFDSVTHAAVHVTSLCFNVFMLRKNLYNERFVVHRACDAWLTESRHGQIMHSLCILIEHEAGMRMSTRFSCIRYSQEYRIVCTIMRLKF